MSDKKGFSLIEIIVVLIIITVLAAMAIPSYMTSQMQGAASAAQNNLVTIYNAEKAYYLNATTGTVYYAGATAATLNTNLNLNITDNYFNYSCTTTNITPPGPTFSCTATNVSNSSFILTVTSGTPTTPNSIVFPGGTGCTSGNTTKCNPSCVDVANPTYCPSASN